MESPYQSILQMQIAQLASSSEEAMCFIYRRYAGRVKGFAMTLLGDVEEARDVTHEVFMSLWENRSKLKDVRDFEGYLYAMTRHAVGARIKARDREIEARSSGNVAVEDDEQEMLHEISDMQLAEALERLPEPQRTMLKMAKLEGRSYREIAAHYGVTEHNVHYHISQALKKMRRYLALF